MTMPEVSRAGRFHLSFLPIPALAVLMATIYLSVDPSVFYDPPWLILIGNTLFVAVVSLVVSYIALRNYSVTGRIQILMLGCGVLLFGIGGLLAAVVRGVPGGANLNVTIYNTGALFGAAFHFVAALILLAGVSPEAGFRRRRTWLFLGYAGCVLFMALLTAASLKGMVPPFFIQGVGPTLLRQRVLGTADVLFVFSFLVFLGTYLRNKEAFLYWYACALALTVISLTAFLIESSVGSPVGWVGRFSQYVGGVYFLVSLVATGRAARNRGTSLDNVLTASLSGVEEKFRALAENAPDAIRRFDRELKQLYVNAAGLRLYGKPAGAVIGRPLQEAGLSEAQYGLWKERILKVFQTGQRIEVEDYLPAGKGTGYYLSQCVPEYGPDGTVANVLVVSRDLTDRKRAEDALRESEGRYQSLVNLCPDAILVHADGKYVFANPAAARLFGAGPGEEVVGRDVLELIPPDDRPVARRRLEQACGGEVTALREMRFLRLDGSPVDVEVTGAGVEFDDKPAIQIVVRDITERKRSRQSLQQARERLDLAQRAAGAGIWDWDVATGKIEWSPQMFELFGIDPQTVTPLLAAWESVLHPDDREIAATRIERALAERADLRSEYRIVRPDGQVRWISALGRGSYNERGRPIRMGGICIDITDRKRADEALRQARDNLEIQVRERTAELRQAIERLKEENAERVRTEQSLRLERARLDALLRLSQMSDASVAEMAGFVLEHGIALTGSRIGFVGFLSEDEAVYTLHAVSKDVVKECNVAGNPMQWRVPGAGIWADAIRERRTLFINDYSQPHPRKKGLPPGHLPLQRFMVVPVFDGKRITAVAGVGDKGSDYDESDERQIALLLGGMWSCMERNRSREALQKAHDELEQRVNERTAELAAANAELQEEITERKRAEEELHKLNRTLRALSKSNQALMHARVESEYLDEVCKIIVKDCGHAMVWIGYAEEDEARSVRPVAYSGLEEGYLETLKITWADTERGRGPTGTAIRTGKPCGCGNMLTDPRFGPWRAEAAKRGYASSMALPLLADGKAFGAVTIYSRESDPFSQAELRLLTELADDVANGITTIRARLAHARAEALLQQSEQRFRTLVDATFEGVAITEAGKYVDANEQLLQMFGYERDELIGMEVAATIAPEDRERVSASIRAGRESVTEHQIVRKDGSRRAVETHGRTITYQNRQIQFTAIRDITDRKENEEALKAAKIDAERRAAEAEEGRRILDALMEYVPEGITIADAPDAKIRMVSRYGQELLGGSHEGLTGEQVAGQWNVYHKDGVTPMANADLPLTRAIVHGKTIRNEELVQVNARGQRLTLLCNAAPIRNRSGTVIGGVVAWRDITERKRAEEALRETADELARSNQDLEQFAYVASHDLQEPLRMVTSYMGLLKQRYADKLDPTADEFIGYAVDGAKRMSQLISDLLAYSRVGTRGGEPRPTDCREVMAHVLETLRFAIEDNQTVVTHDPLPTVHGDATQLRQLFQNLISNAIKFRREEPPRIHVGARSAEGMWEFAVRDNGIGMDQRHSDRIFRMFQRLHTRDKYPGTGIGLAICRKIVERHGGRIWVESEPGTGSTFYFTLPAAPAPSA
jgi:PAS domain S-box-containing protein